MSESHAELAALRQAFGASSDELTGAEAVLAPRDAGEASAALRWASRSGARVLVRGGGTHQGLGYPLDPDLVISTERLGSIVAWEPEDLTLVVEAGAPVSRVEAMLAERGQTAVMPERPGSATIGGVVSAGVSGFRRRRYGPTRDRMLEVTLVTGDGRLVTGGGRVVKNVSGYDLPRLAVGAFGSLGLVVSVCLKLWPIGESLATVTLDDPDRADLLSRPLAVLDLNGQVTAYLGGTPGEVDEQSRLCGGERRDGLVWPDDPAGTYRWSLRVPPKHTRYASGRVPNGWDRLALLGVGEIRLASASIEGHRDLRAWAEGIGGALVMVDGPDEAYADLDPWGTPPASVEIQRRLIAAFDPARVINPGRLPGRL
ncbi:MAG TPA: FAD-binding protein [Acidimicrobiia bacterium]